MTRLLIFLVVCVLGGNVLGSSMRRGTRRASTLSTLERDTLRALAVGPSFTGRDRSDVFSGKQGILIQGVADDDDNTIPSLPGVPSLPSVAPVLGGGPEAPVEAPVSPSHGLSPTHRTPVSPSPGSGDETPASPVIGSGDETPASPAIDGGDDEEPSEDGTLHPAKPPAPHHKPAPVARPTSFTTEDDDKVAVTNDPMPTLPGSDSGSGSGSSSGSGSGTSHSTGASSSSSSAGARSYGPLEICALVTVLAAMVALLVAVPMCVWKCNKGRNSYNFSGPLPDTTSRVPMPTATAGGYASALQFSESGQGMDASNAALMSALTPAPSPAKGASVLSPLMAAAAHNAISKQPEASAPEALDLESGGQASRIDGSPVPPPPAPMGVESSSGKGSRGTTPRKV